MAAWLVLTLAWCLFITAVESLPNLSISSNTIQRFVSPVIDRRGHDEEARALKKVLLSNSSVTCNDGSRAGFYLRKSHGSKKWIVFLEGGWYCYDQESCRNRWFKMRNLMTSSLWPEAQNGEGILSPYPSANPHWYNANHVLVPYCTSDVWSGNRPVSRDYMFSFMGSAVVRQVILDLTQLGLDNSTELLLTGSSAGGTGAMINLDPVRELLHDELGLKEVSVKGVCDSGWFLDRAPYVPTNHLAVEAIRKGMRHWHGRVPDACRQQYKNEPWSCYFGYRLYPTLKSPLFVFQWLFDEAQMTVDNVGAPVNKQQWDYIHKMGEALRHSFVNVTAVFAPSCISHNVLTKQELTRVLVNDVSVAQALHCWDLKTTTRPPNAPRHHVSKQQHHQQQQHHHHQQQHGRLPESGYGPRMPPDRPKKRRCRRKHHRNRKNDNEEQPSSNSSSRKKNNNNSNNKPNKRRNNRRNCHNVANRKHRNRLRQQNLERRPHRFQRSPMRPPPSHHHLSHHPNCQLRIMEKCTWPQCNRSCPKLLNPYNGEEMDFIELLQSFGLDMQKVAQALGISYNELIAMDPEKLLRLLTENTK